MSALALGTFATYNPQAIPAETSLQDALELMNSLRVHHLPVVNERHGIVGIVSHRDLVTRCGTRRGQPPQSTLPVSQVMVRGVFTIDHAATPLVALRAILDHKFHSVPVLEDGALVGMITSTDFLRELSYGEWPVCQDRVEDHMVAYSQDELLFSAATEVDALRDGSSVVSAGQSLGTAAGLMLEFNVREIAVVDDRGAPVGVLRDDDILLAIASMLA